MIFINPRNSPSKYRAIVLNYKPIETTYILNSLIISVHMFIVVCKSLLVRIPDRSQTLKERVSRYYG